MNYQERKAARVERFKKSVEGWKLRPCIACNGSGRYDHNGSPKCGACDGTGKERYKPGPEPVQPALNRNPLAELRALKREIKKQSR